MKVFKVFYRTEYDSPKVIRIVKEDSIMKYVQELIEDGVIMDEDIEVWKEHHFKGIMTETDAIELLETAGFYVEKTELYE